MLLPFLERVFVGTNRRRPQLLSIELELIKHKLMAVQAQYSSSILPYLRNWTTQLLEVDNGSLLPPISTHGTSIFLQDCELSPGTANEQQLLHSIVTSHPGANLPFFRGHSGADVSQHVFASGKRAWEPVELLFATQRQQHPTLSLGDFHQPRRSSPMVSQTSGLVSTGLRLAFDDERVKTCRSASGKMEMTSPAILSTLSADLSALLLQEREEIDKFLLTQAEQLKRLFEEKRQRLSRALLVAIEEGVSRRSRENQFEFAKMNLRNMELEDFVKRLRLEAQMWQTKAKKTETMVTALRSNLQHAVAQSREGCGDSEADDAASAHYDETVEGHQGSRVLLRSSRELMSRQQLVRACRMCRTNEVSILLLPCRHLCVCKECEGQVEICPLCQCVKNASVEVYMS